MCKLLFHQLLKKAEDAEAVSKLEKLFHALLGFAAPGLDPAEQAMESHGRGEVGSGARTNRKMCSCQGS